INYIQIFHHLAKTRVVAVEVRRVRPAMADEKLRTSGIAPPVSHGKYATVVVLIPAVQLAFNGIPRTAGPGSRRIASLDHKIRNDPVKRYPVIVTGFSQF